MAHPLTPTFAPQQMRDAWRADYDTPILSRLSSTPNFFRRHSADSVNTRDRQTQTTTTTTAAAMSRPRPHGSEVQPGPHSHGRSIRVDVDSDDDDEDDGEKDDEGGDELDRRRKDFAADQDREDLSVLVDFLKNTKPPPENYMSIPSETLREAKGRGKWSMLRRVGRRRSRSLPKAPPKPLVLPDSAVSGITIGGHRHIAISIPLEAMPFAEAANSHCYDSSARPYANPDPDLLLPIPNREKAIPISQAPGVGALSLAPAPKTCRPFRAMSSTQFGQRANPPAYKGHERRNSQQDQVSCSCSEGPNAALCQMKMEQLQETGYPARRSSVTASRGYTLTTTTDGMASYYRNVKNTSSGMHTFQSYTWLPVSRGAASPSKRSSRQPSPISEEPSGSESVGKKEHVSEGEATVVSNASASSGTYLGSDPGPPLAHDENVARASPRLSIACRREKVRDKKRRDMEALRKAKESGQPLKGGKPEALANSDVAASGVSGPQLVLCPIQVVVDMEPVLVSAKRPESFNEKLQRLAEAQNQRNSLVSVDSSLSSASHRAPLSTLNGSPLPKQRLPIKTRPDHRRVVEREDKASRDGGHRRAHPSHQLNKESQTDRQILRLYDTYRENRIQDAERRIRKLENNRDIWLQALIPLLDDMNQTMKAVNSNRIKSREVIALDEAVAVAHDAQAHDPNDAMTTRTSARTRASSEGKPRAVGRKKGGSKDMSLSREKLVALLAQKLEEIEDCDEECDNDDDDDAEGWYKRTKLLSDANGMVPMELLMKELAGEATRRQRRMAAEMRGNAD